MSEPIRRHKWHFSELSVLLIEGNVDCFPRDWSVNYLLWQFWHGLVHLSPIGTAGPQQKRLRSQGESGQLNGRECPRSGCGLLNEVIPTVEN